MDKNDEMINRLINNDKMKKIKNEVIHYATLPVGAFFGHEEVL